MRKLFKRAEISGASMGVLFAVLIILVLVVVVIYVLKSTNRTAECTKLSFAVDQFRRDSEESLEVFRMEKEFSIDNLPSGIQAVCFVRPEELGEFSNGEIILEEQIPQGETWGALIFYPTDKTLSCIGKEYFLIKYLNVTSRKCFDLSGSVETVKFLEEVKGLPFDGQSSSIKIKVYKDIGERYVKLDPEDYVPEREEIEENIILPEISSGSCLDGISITLLSSGGKGKPESLGGLENPCSVLRTPVSSRNQDTSNRLVFRFFADQTLLGKINMDSSEKEFVENSFIISSNQATEMESFFISQNALSRRGKEIVVSPESTDLNNPIYLDLSTGRTTSVNRFTRLRFDCALGDELQGISLQPHCAFEKYWIVIKDSKGNLIKSMCSHTGGLQINLCTGALPPPPPPVETGGECEPSCITCTPMLCEESLVGQQDCGGCL